jgi:serine/threonine protein kinase
MSKRTLTCPCGHTWEHPDSGPLPPDLRAICPLCSSGDQATLGYPTPAATPTPPEGPPKKPDVLGPGHVLGGFEILQEVKRGGMGVIYKARQLGFDRLVALKVIAPERLGHADVTQRFHREVRAAALLNHPNIVTVFHTDLSGPHPYLAMEFVPGIDLHTLVKKAGPLSIADACRYARQVARGLQHASEQGLVHRDIKPANLMVTPSPLDRPEGAGHAEEPLVKILDMGLARVVTPDEAGEGGHLTRTGELLGTPDFMAPEQGEDARNADTRCDIYSLGGTLYFLLVGQVPFPGQNLMQKLRRQLTEDPPSPAAARPDVPVALDALIRRMMARDPRQRPQTPAEVIEALDAILHEPEAWTPDGPSEIVAHGPHPGLPSPSSQRLPRPVLAHPGGVQAMCLSGDGQVLLSGGQDETLRLWDAHRLREIRCIAGNVGPVESVSLTVTGRWAASCALRLFQSDMVVQLWDLGNGKEVRRLKGPTDNIRCVSIAPDARRVAAGCHDGTVRIWAVDQPGSPSLCLRGHTGLVTSVLLMPGGTTLLSAGNDGTVRLWDARTGAAKGTIPGKVGPIQSLAYCPTTRGLAIAGRGLRVRNGDGSWMDYWGHRDDVLCLAFSLDGQRLLSGGSDHSVRLWQVEDGEELFCSEEHTDRVTAVAFSRDGKVGFSASADGILRRWPLSG